MTREYSVSIAERYADGHAWQDVIRWNASAPDIAACAVLNANRRRKPLTGHGRVVSVTATATEEGT